MNMWHLLPRSRFCVPDPTVSSSAGCLGRAGRGAGWGCITVTRSILTPSEFEEFNMKLQAEVATLNAGSPIGLG
jgi:hypothetical protein